MKWCGMPLSPEDLQHIAARTLAHYEQHARSYWEGTRDHDVSQNNAALLKHQPGPPPFDLLTTRLRLGGDLRRPLAVANFVQALGAAIYLGMRRIWARG